MSLEKKNQFRSRRRAMRTRNKQVDRRKKFRISVFRSLGHIYVQLIDDNQHKTLASSSSHTVTKEAGLKKADVAERVGKELAKLAIEQGHTKVFFDRGKYLCHGRIARLVHGLREGGLQL